MARLRERAEGLQQQIATGERIAISSDDPVAAAQLRGLARAERLAQVDTASAASASTSLRLADDVLQSLGEQITRARELTVQAASDAISDDDRKLIGLELEAIYESMFSAANTVDGNGRPLFAGNTGGPAYALDASGLPAYAGSAVAAEADLGDGVIFPLGVTGPDVFNFTADGTPTNMLAFVKSLSVALQGGVADPAGAARAALDGFAEGLDSLSRAQTSIGVRVAWIETVQDRQFFTAEARAEQQLDTGGVDFASTIAELQQMLTVLEASQASFARLSQLSLFNAI